MLIFRFSKEEIKELKEPSEPEEKEVREAPRARKSNKMVDKGSDRLKDIYMDKLKKSIEPVRIFNSKPVEDPLKVCFDFTGTDLTHKQVKVAANRTLSESDGCHVTDIEFVPRNVILGTTWCDNRWVLGVNSKLAHRMISGKGIHIEGNYIRVRSYQDVMNEEYDRFLQKSQKDGAPSLVDDLLAAENVD